MKKIWSWHPLIWAMRQRCQWWVLLLLLLMLICWLLMVDSFHQQQNDYCSQVVLVPTNSKALRQPIFARWRHRQIISASGGARRRCPIKSADCALRAPDSAPRRQRLGSARAPKVYPRQWKHWVRWREDQFHPVRESGELKAGKRRDCEPRPRYEKRPEIIIQNDPISKHKIDFRIEFDFKLKWWIG